MRNYRKPPVPEHVQQVVDAAVDECLAGGLSIGQVFAEPHRSDMTDEIVEHIGVDLTNPTLKRAAERFVRVAVANNQSDKTAN